MAATNLAVQRRGVLEDGCMRVALRYLRVCVCVCVTRAREVSAERSGTGRQRGLTLPETTHYKPRPLS